MLQSVLTFKTKFKKRNNYFQCYWGHRPPNRFGEMAAFIGGSVRQCISSSNR